MTRQTLRETLRVNNSRFGDTLTALLSQGRALRTETGWLAVLPQAGDAAQQALPLS